MRSFFCCLDDFLLLHQTEAFPANVDIDEILVTLDVQGLQGFHQQELLTTPSFQHQQIDTSAHFFHKEGGPFFKKLHFQAVILFPKALQFSLHRRLPLVNQASSSPPSISRFQRPNMVASIKKCPQTLYHLKMPTISKPVGPDRKPTMKHLPYLLMSPFQPENRLLLRQNHHQTAPQYRFHY